MSSRNLAVEIPEVVRRSAQRIADNYSEKLIGYYPITEERYNYRVMGWSVMTDKCVFEFDLEGYCRRSRLIHSF